MTAAIKVNTLSKSFDTVKAVDNVSFTVNQNEMFGFAGPDGAGKTTIIRMLCGLVKPDNGIATMFGKDVWKESRKIKNEIGYLSQKFSLYTDLTLDENIEFFADIHGVKPFKDRRDELLEFMRLTRFRKFLAGNLSGGMKQKLALACTLIHKPRIIFLDEPTTGVDPVSRRDFWKILSELLKEGITIVITTPYMDEAERFNTIALINNGNIMETGTPEKIKNNFKDIIAEIVCEDTRKAYKLIKKEGYETQIFGDRLNILLKEQDELSKVISILENEKIKLNDTRLKQPSLENVFISLMT